MSLMMVTFSFIGDADVVGAFHTMICERCDDERWGVLEGDRGQLTVIGDANSLGPYSDQIRALAHSEAGIQ